MPAVAQAGSKIAFTKTPGLTHPKYRPDIDGLRAIAVLSVVIFHTFPNVISGGFIGVDIFFVISGYLISSIIIDNLEHNRFSFIDFYSRRIKRIYPALLTVLIACFAFGWFVLLADEFKQLAKHIVGGAGFISNFVLGRESGYFDNIAETKPLLHLWSLGVEEQFYIVWPLLLWFGWKRRFNLMLMALIMALTSFMLSVYMFQRNPINAFYSPFARFWELLMGSILAYMSLHQHNVISTLKDNYKNRLNQGLFKFWVRQWENILSFIGINLIVIGLVFLDKDSLFPGWSAILPTLGASLILAAGHQAWFNRSLLSNRVIVWFGLISYPLYLWHWPLLAYARILYNDTPPVTVRAAALLTSIALAWLTFQLIEKPVRLNGDENKKTKILFILMIVMGSLGYVTFKHNGFGFRLGERQVFEDYFENNSPDVHYFQKINLVKNYREVCDYYDNYAERQGHATQLPRKKLADECIVRNAEKTHAVMIWGDSHGQQLYYGLKVNLPASWQILQVTTSACNPNAQNLAPSTTNSCKQSNWLAFKTIQETKPDVIIIAQSDGQIAEAFNSLAASLKKLAIKKIIFMGPTTHWTSDLPRVIVREMWESIPRRSFIGVNQQVLAENTALQINFKSTSSIILVDLISFFCNAQGCLTYLGDDVAKGEMSWDYGHLTPMASDYLAKNLLVNLVVSEHSKVK